MVTWRTTFQSGQHRALQPPVPVRIDGMSALKITLVTSLPGYAAANAVGVSSFAVPNCLIAIRHVIAANC
jgi:hypothetical protein